MLKLSASSFRFWDLGFRVQDLGFWVLGVEVSVQGPRFRVLEFCVEDLECQGLRLKV